jgi:N-terminal acetyltransferase B complex catalytic subunit
MIPGDLLKLNDVNLDSLTENFSPDFYMEYLLLYSYFCYTVECEDGTIGGYLIGKPQELLGIKYGHVTAISVAPQFRHGTVAKQLMTKFHNVCKSCNCKYTDLFVRKSNINAVTFYEKLGYTVHRCITNYYTGPDSEDALEMQREIMQENH